MICKKESCTGCFACFNICPKKCISMKEDKCGYIYPIINENICIKCGLCKKVCPSLESVKFNNPQKAYAAWALDNKERESSTSGGVASVFSKIILKKNGIVFGAAINKDKRVNHIRVETLDKLKKLKGSKYVHSYIEDMYKKCEEDLKIGVDVLFIGTPCQIAGLKKYLRKEYLNLFTVDIICHGVPSQKLLQDYINKDIRNNTYDYISFRNKDGYCFKLYKDNKEIYSKSMKESLYLLGFMNALFLRENCYSCKYAQEERVSDVTIGDFWGLGDDVEFNHSKKGGVSLILSNTIKGDKLINLCKEELFLEERSIKEAIKGNAQLRRPSIKHKNYSKFQREYPSKGFVRATKNGLRTDIIKDKLREILIKNKHIHKIGKKLKNINRVVI